MKKLFASLALAAAVAPVWAATQTVTLAVPGMTCAACPITVKKALSKVEGVSKVDVGFEKREAVVTFDDTKASVQKLTKATADACFPALASFGAAIGLGFLSQYEGLFISRLLPLFAALAFLANALGWFSHRQWLRSLLGMIGPAIVFAATVWLLGNWWTANLMYVGLALMIGVSIWDFVSPAHRRCGPDGCELPAKRL
ncbi:organomercurial transporter MerC [Salmonella enterica]|nr:organomercurial transporter MerC [Salmonella enterica]